MGVRTGLIIVLLKQVMNIYLGKSGTGDNYVCMFWNTEVFA